MPMPSKFTAERRTRILEALRIGASHQTAAALAGISEATLRSWLARGRDGESEGRWAEFYQEVLAAEAHPRDRALAVIYREIPDNPTLAWKFIERKEPGYAPPMNHPAAPQQPVRINLTLAGGAPIPETVIEVADAQDETTGSGGELVALPAPAPSD